MDTEGSVLFLEDIAEKPYRIDRLLTQLRQAGVLTTDNLTPQKARLLLALALTKGAGEVERIFSEY